MNDEGLIPDISVLMPVRDGARWLGEAIDSVLSQTHRNFELIVVNDGSIDATAEIIRGYALRDERIVALDQPPTGLVAALNKGLAAARAPLIARLDADDIAEPSRLARQIACLRDHPEISVLGTWSTDISPGGNVIARRRPCVEQSQLKALLSTANPLIHSSVMFRTRQARDVGGYRAPFAVAEDYDLWLRMSERGTIAILPEALIRYRVHPESITARQVVHQLFATRIAQRSAALRQLSGEDPADRLAETPDGWSDAPSPYSEEVRLFRLLSWAEPQTIPPSHRSTAPRLSDLSDFKLNRRERQVAQLALARIAKLFPGESRPSLWWRLFTLGRKRSLLIIWRHFTDSTAIKLKAH